MRLAYHWDLMRLYNLPSQLLLCNGFGSLSFLSNLNKLINKSYRKK